MIPKVLASALIAILILWLWSTPEFLDPTPPKIDYGLPTWIPQYDPKSEAAAKPLPKYTIKAVGTRKFGITTYTLADESGKEVALPGSSEHNFKPDTQVQAEVDPSFPETNQIWIKPLQSPSHDN